MIYTIKNENLSVSVSDIGAEMTSVRHADGTELLWQGDANYWTGHAPIMFPICGRLYEGNYTYRGQTYTMPNHGIARRATFVLKSQTDTRLELSLVANEETKQQYPFSFVFTVCFALKENKLSITYTVENTDNKPMPYAVGGHPAFNVPQADGAFSDWSVTFSRTGYTPKRLAMTDRGYCTHADTVFPLVDGKCIPLTHRMFDHDAIFLYDTDRTITLSAPSAAHPITMHFADFPYIGLWHTNCSDAPFLCMEPWSSIPADDGVIDDLETKREMFTAQPNEIRTFSYTVEIG